MAAPHSPSLLSPHRRRHAARLPPPRRLGRVRAGPGAGAGPGPVSGRRCPSGRPRLLRAVGAAGAAAEAGQVRPSWAPLGPGGSLRPWSLLGPPICFVMTLGNLLLNQSKPSPSLLPRYKDISTPFHVFLSLLCTSL